MHQPFHAALALRVFSPYINQSWQLDVFSLLMPGEETEKEGPSLQTTALQTAKYRQYLPISPQLRRLAIPEH